MVAAEGHELLKQVLHDVLIHVLSLELVPEHTGFAKVQRSFILMNFVLLKVELKHRNESEVAPEVALHQSDCQLVGLWLFDLLPEFAVHLVEVLKLSLVHHREICPELQKLARLGDCVLSFSLGLRKPGPDCERLLRYFVAQIDAVLIVDQDVQKRDAGQVNGQRLEQSEHVPDNLVLFVPEVDREEIVANVGQHRLDLRLRVIVVVDLLGEEGKCRQIRHLFFKLALGVQNLTDLLLEGLADDPLREELQEASIELDVSQLFLFLHVN